MSNSIVTIPKADSSVEDKSCQQACKEKGFVNCLFGLESKKKFIVDDPAYDDYFLASCSKILSYSTQHSCVCSPKLTAQCGTSFDYIE